MRSQISTFDIFLESYRLVVLNDMERYSTINDVQSLNRNLVALRRFQEMSAEKSIPFFQSMKNHVRKNGITWIREAEEAFRTLKEHLLTTLANPKVGKPLEVYLSSNHDAIGAVMIAEIEKK